MVGTRRRRARDSQGVAEVIECGTVEVSPQRDRAPLKLALVTPTGEQAHPSVDPRVA